jgi:hypothetical protein
MGYTIIVAKVSVFYIIYHAQEVEGKDKNKTNLQEACTPQANAGLQE